LNAGLLVLLSYFVLFVFFVVPPLFPGAASISWKGL
jgi:hypothetical protein